MCISYVCYRSYVDAILPEVYEKIRGHGAIFGFPLLIVLFRLCINVIWMTKAVGMAQYERCRRCYAQYQ